ncbi:unnamed protein product [Gongylonema pulchrum]|uniref:EF-hand domain-containing protein n=1 Tax=Gongylonema pulchrum TaxID=637853 RepID=A0A183EVW2_9BILA|nr:unnamed protein product [Gongylonema pulchrum]
MAVYFFCLRKYSVLLFQGITVEEVEAFFCFLYFIEDVDLALHFYNVAGAGVTGEVLKTVARKVVGREISDRVVDVVMTLFDENEVTDLLLKNAFCVFAEQCSVRLAFVTFAVFQDGVLSQSEFVSIMKKRAKRGLEQPKDTGLIKILDAVGRCTITMAKDLLVLA